MNRIQTIPSAGASALESDERSQRNIEFFEELVTKLHLGSPVVVSASVSHRYIVGFINKHREVKKQLNMFS